MSLLEAATAGRLRGNRCWAQSLPDHLADQLRDVEDAFDADPEGINQAALSRELKTEGVIISDVGRHLRRECKCRS